MSAEFLGFMQLASGAMSRGVDPNEILQYLSWRAYAAIAGGYTVFVFSVGILEKFIGISPLDQHGTDSLPEDSRNSAWKIVGPFSRVMRVHGWFLLIQLCGLGTIALVVPYLPHWITNTFDTGRNVRASIIDFLCIFAAPTLGYYERRRLCSKPKTP